jgi:ribosomal protein S18 acetylase RimI-like enzyme
MKVEVYQKFNKLKWIDLLKVGILENMPNENKIIIRVVAQSDQSWIENFYIDRWGSNRVVSRGVTHDISQLPGFVAWRSSNRVGLLTYQIVKKEFEIVTLDSLEEKTGIGSALISNAVDYALKSSCQRVWLITTNDNIPALHFYQKRGFHLVAVYRNALARSRLLKPEIPNTGLFGIPLRDEIELEILLNP